MKKLLLIVGLLLGMSASKVQAGGYFSSTWTAVSISSGTAFDITDVWVSTGWNIGQCLILIDSVAVTSLGIGTPILSAAFTPDQYILPPIPFVPSTAAVSGSGLQHLDLNGVRPTVRKGLVAVIVGPAGHQPSYTINYEQVGTGGVQRR